MTTYSRSAPFSLRLTRELSLCLRAVVVDIVLTLQKLQHRSKRCRKVSTTSRQPALSETELIHSSFATSVASRSLTLRQACVAAAICEFLGAVLVGARVAGTIKNGIISLSVFRGNAGVQMLGFTCALVASATWLMIATINSWPVSTTYSIVSALAGVGVALGGSGAVQWGWNGGKGLGTIYAGMVIAPALAAGFGAVIYLITKYAVLERKNPIKAGLIISPMYFFTVAAVLTMSIGKLFGLAP